MIPEAPEEIDSMMNQLLGCSEAEYTYLAVGLPDEPVPVYIAFERLTRWLRRRVYRRTDYVPAEAKIRLNRTGLPWSWTEEIVMSWVRQKSSETPSDKQVTSEYISVLLQRPVEEIVTKRRTRSGIEGFDL